MMLYPHQFRAMEETRDLDHVAYFWAMGTGKTYVGSEKLMQLGNQVSLVVCQKSKIEDWLDHFRRHYKCHALDLTKKFGMTSFWEYQKLPAPVPIIGIINYELVWRREELMDLTDFTLLLDESSLIQNETAQRSKFILQMKPKGVILLSGTPTGGKYENLWSQMHLLGWGISKKTYWNQYVEVEYLDTIGRSIPIVTGYKKVDRLKKKMYQYGARFLRSEEVLGLPKQTFIETKVSSSKEYRKFRKSSLVTVEGIELAGDTTLTKLLYERQLCGMYCKEKRDAFRDLLESTEERMVVFYNFTAELHSLEQIAVEAGKTISVINGTKKDLSAYDQDEGSVTFVQYQAGAMGLNLQKACRAIYFTLPLSSELFEQSKKRIHRIGQERPCFYYLMLCRGSVEEKILQTLEMRRDYTEELFRKEKHDRN